MHREGKQIVESPIEARAGFLDRPVLYVLIASAALTVVALWATGVVTL